MKRFVLFVLCAAMVLSLAACGKGSAPATTSGTDAAEGTQAQAVNADFYAGFGKTDITPKESVPMASYGDDRNRWSEGMITYLEARAVALKDAPPILPIRSAWQCPKN